MSTTRCNRFNSSSRSRLSRRLSGFALCRYEPRRIYRATAITAGRVLNTSLEDTAVTKDQAQSYLNAARLKAQTSLETNATALIGRFGQTIQIINNGVTYESGYIENENIELKVCFVAGTPMLKADGTPKPIEQILHRDIWIVEEYTDGLFNLLYKNSNTRFVYRECICSKPSSYRTGMVQYADQDYIANIEKAVPEMNKLAYKK